MLHHLFSLARRAPRPEVDRDVDDEGEVDSAVTTDGDADADDVGVGVRELDRDTVCDSVATAMRKTSITPRNVHILII